MSKTIRKPRNYVAKDMFTSGLYREKVVENKKSFKRREKHKVVYNLVYDNSFQYA